MRKFGDVMHTDTKIEFLEKEIESLRSQIAFYLNQLKEKDSIISGQEKSLQSMAKLSEK